jgi:hypothetical protein
MNRSFNPISPLQRSVLAIAAVFATVLTFGSLAGLVEHYSGGPGVAAAQTVVVAQR